MLHAFPSCSRSRLPSAWSLRVRRLRERYVHLCTHRPADEHRVQPPSIFDVDADMEEEDISDPDSEDAPPAIDVSQMYLYIYHSLI